MKIGFQQLHRIVRVCYEVTTRSSLSIGTGKGDGFRDTLVIREGGSDVPVIPGSTVKGMVRSTLESILATAQPGKICIPSTCGGRKPRERPAAKGDEDRQRTVPDQPAPGRRWDCGDTGAPPCLVCQMFGNMLQAGCASFRDAHLVEPDVVEVGDRTHIALTRHTKTASRGALLVLESVPPGARFRGEVLLTNPEPWMVGAVIEAVEMLGLVGLGGKKNSGYGEVEAKAHPIEHPVLVGDAKEQTRAEYVQEWQAVALCRAGAGER